MGCRLFTASACWAANHAARSARTAQVCANNSALAQNANDVTDHLPHLTPRTRGTSRALNAATHDTEDETTPRKTFTQDYDGTYTARDTGDTIGNHHNRPVAGSGNTGRQLEPQSLSESMDAHQHARESRPVSP
ncbi:hypothetical protein MRS44_007425 [Fusarium solani]|uniref:uncharacterized protein n=1 Tax=Fusarium solani TaxID=169388 RepID=UPI0032C44646|nr:hypothetical protein MRS44_007425 [Fusarium solani]